MMIDISAAGRQSDVEKEVFFAFANTCVLPIDPDSIQNREPPEPDILCHVSGEGNVAFEMVELVEQPVARGYNSAPKFKKLLTDAYDGLQDPRKSAVEERIGNAFISIAFHPNTYVRDWKKSIPHLFRLFENIDPSFTGKIPLCAWSSHLPMVKRIVITRCDSSPRPIFNLDHGGSFGDPVQERISAKFHKSYQTSHPIELLGYYLYQPPFPPEIWLPVLRSMVENYLVTSPFRRVWIFDCAAKDLWQA